MSIQLRSDALTDHNLERIIRDYERRIRSMEERMPRPSVATARVFDAKLHGGAAGDGVTDDSGAINALIERMDEGSEIYFPAGIYHYTSPLVINSRDRLALSGPGILTPDACDGFQVDNCETIYFNGLRIFTAQSAGGTTTAIDFNANAGNVRFAHVHQCHIQGFKYGVRARSSGGSGPGVSHLQVRNSWIELVSPSIAGSVGVWFEMPDNKIYQCRIFRYRTGIALDAGGQLVEGNHIANTSADSPLADVAIRRGYTAAIANGYVFTGNYFDGAPADGHLIIEVRGASHVIGSTNYFRASESTTQFILFETAGAATDVSDFSFIGNDFLNVGGSNMEALGFSAIQTDDSSHFFFHSNTFGTNITKYSTHNIRQSATVTTSPYTPNAMLGRTITLTLQINVTINVMSANYKGGIGNRVTFIIIQDATGGRTVAWNADYKQAWSDTGNTANKKSSITFEWDGTDWQQIGAQSPYY